MADSVIINSPLSLIAMLISTKEVVQRFGRTVTVAKHRIVWSSAKIFRYQLWS